MSKKRGLSLEEKRDQVLAVFHESADVFQLKDVEKLAMKRGVVLQTIKDVLQSLVDDDLVHQDKLGSSNFFWSFPSEASVKLTTAVQKAEAELEGLKRQRITLNEQLTAAKAGQSDAEARAAKAVEVAALTKQLAQLQAEQQQYSDCDPETLEAMRQAAGTAKDAANRWLDNCWLLQSWLKNKYAGMEDELASFFKQNGLTEDLDYM